MQKIAVSYVSACAIKMYNRTMHRSKHAIIASLTLGIATYIAAVQSVKVVPML